MRFLFFVILFFFAFGLSAQKFPYDFPVKSNAVGTDHIYSQKKVGSIYSSEKILFSTAKEYFTPNVNLTSVAYVPTASGNASNRMEFIEDGNGDIWYIDSQGDAYKLSNNNISAADIANVPFGNISASNVQDAINELDNEKLNKSDSTSIYATIYRTDTISANLRDELRIQVEKDGNVLSTAADVLDFNSDYFDITESPQDEFTFMITSPLSDIIEGIAIDKPDVDIVNDGGVLYVEIEKIGGGDMSFFLNGQVATLDCTTGSGTGGKARVALTAGADTNSPALNYIYITGSGNIASLNAGANVPNGAFCWIGKILIPDVTTWTTEGAYMVQRFTESLNDSRGQLSHHREKTRLGLNGYSSGVAPSFSIESALNPDSLVFTTTGGKVYQMHMQSWPVFNNDKFYYGNGLDIYGRLDNLNEARELSDGTTISNNNYYSLVLWGGRLILTLHPAKCL